MMFVRCFRHWGRSSHECPRTGTDSRKQIVTKVDPLAPPNLKFAKNPALFRAAETGNVGALLDEVSKAGDPTRIALMLCGTTKEGWTALHVAVGHGHVDAVLALIQHGGPIDWKSTSGWTPVHVAIHRRQTNCLKLLLEHGANPNCIIKSKGIKKRVIDFAVDRGYFDMALILLRFGATVEYHVELDKVLTKSHGDMYDLFDVKNKPTHETTESWSQRNFKEIYAHRVCAALQIQTWFRKNVARKTYMELRADHHSAVNRSKHFLSIRELCVSDENFDQVVETLKRYHMEEKSVVPESEALRTSNVPQTLQYYTPRRFFRKRAGPIFVWSSPQTANGKARIIGVVGESDRIVVQGAQGKDEATFRETDKTWIRIANPEIETGVFLYGNNEAWCISHCGETTWLAIEPHVDYTAMGSGMWRSRGIEIANLDVPSSYKGCPHHYSLVHRPHECFICGEPKPPPKENKSVLTFEFKYSRMAALMKPMDTQPYEELLATALKGQATKVMKLLCNMDSRDIHAPCDYFFAIGFSDIGTFRNACGGDNPSTFAGCERHMKFHSQPNPSFFRCHHCTPAIRDTCWWRCDECNLNICRKCVLKKSPSACQAAAMSNDISMMAIMLGSCNSRIEEALFPASGAHNSCIVLACNSDAVEVAVYLIEEFASTMDIVDNHELTDIVERVFQLTTRIACSKFQIPVLNALKECKYDFQLAVAGLPKLDMKPRGGLSLYLNQAMSGAQTLDISVKEVPIRTVRFMPALVPFATELFAWIDKARDRIRKKHLNEVIANIDLLMKMGFTIDAASENGITALMAAAEKNSVWLVRELLHRGADPDLIDKNGINALCYAARGGAYSCVNELVEFRRRRIAKSLNYLKHEVRPIQSHLNSKESWPAAPSGYGMAMQMMECHISEDPKLSPLVIALRKSHFDVARLLMNSGFTISYMPNRNQYSHDFFVDLIRFVVQESMLELASDLVRKDAEQAMAILKTTSQQIVRLSTCSNNNKFYELHENACYQLFRAFSASNLLTEVIGCNQQILSLMMGAELQRCIQIETQRERNNLDTKLIVCKGVPWHLYEHAAAYISYFNCGFPKSMIGHIITNINERVLEENCFPLFRQAVKLTGRERLAVVARCYARMPIDFRAQAMNIINQSFNVTQLIKDQFNKTRSSDAEEQRHAACEFVALVFPDEARKCDVCLEPIKESTSCCIQSGGGHFQKVHCDHEYCRNCISEWIEGNVNKACIHISCPDDNCPFVFSGDDIKRICGESVYDSFLRVSTADYRARVRELVSDSNMQGYLTDKTRLCPNCHVVIERSEGCNSMRCPCGASFEWTAATVTTQADMSEEHTNQTAAAEMRIDHTNYESEI